MRSFSVSIEDSLWTTNRNVNKFTRQLSCPQRILVVFHMMKERSNTKECQGFMPVNKVCLGSDLVHLLPQISGPVLQLMHN